MLGVVMAGGESRRLGADKAFVEFNGEPLWRRQQRVLQAAGAAQVVMIRRADQTAPAEIECWCDLAQDSGPLAGLQVAMMKSDQPWVMVLAVDMPAITAGWFENLQAYCRPGVGAMVQHAEACEPLAAIYPSEALAEIDARLQRRDLSLQRLANALAAQGRMTLVPLASDDIAVVRSVNTRLDLAACRERSHLASFSP